MNKISKILSRFDPISLDELDDVKLLRRYDQKFTITTSQFEDIFPFLANYYHCLTIENQQIFEYSTDYYDFGNYTMFIDHHNGKLNRHKIRFRDYVNTKNTFLEIKFKSNKGETIKSRKEIAYRSREFNLENNKFIGENSPYNPSNLDKKLSNTFQRITLANVANKERVTIDNVINFSHKKDNKILQNLVVIEIKKSKNNMDSSINQLLKMNGIRPTSFSKYAFGSALINPNLKYNRFKKKLSYLNTIHDGTIWH